MTIWSFICYYLYLAISGKFCFQTWPIDVKNIWQPWKGQQRQTSVPGWCPSHISEELLGQTSSNMVFRGPYDTPEARKTQKIEFGTLWAGKHVRGAGLHS